MGQQNEGQGNVNIYLLIASGGWMMVQDRGNEQTLSYFLNILESNTQFSTVKEFQMCGIKIQLKGENTKVCRIKIEIKRKNKTCVQK